jgi:hypothetical protein
MANDLQPKNNVLPQELLDLAKQHAGRGVSFEAEDQLIPLIYVLQTNSPIVDRRSKDVYVEGAVPGHFWLRNAIHPIADGEKGIDVIPCGMQHTWIEWLPNRQGFVTRHNAQPRDMEARTTHTDDGKEKKILCRPNGNLIQDTREFYLIVDGQPYVLPCAGTKHLFARQWQSMFHQYRHPQTGDVMPSFIRKYKLTTFLQTKDQNKWYNIKFEDLGIVTTPEYKSGYILNDSVQKGTRKAEAPIAAHEEPPAANDDDIPF